MQTFSHTEKETVPLLAFMLYNVRSIFYYLYKHYLENSHEDFSGVVTLWTTQ